MATNKTYRLNKASKEGKPLMGGTFKVKLANMEEITSLDFGSNAETKPESAEGYLSGYLSTFNNADHDGDIIRQGAFTKTLKERRPKVLYYHDHRDPIGVLMYAKEDNKGLYGVIKLNLETQRGREVYSHYKMGSMDSFSIGFQLEKYETIKNAAGYTSFDIKEVKLLEVSAVTFPANELAVVESVKESYEEIINTSSEIREMITEAESIDDLINILTLIRDNKEPADAVQEDSEEVVINNTEDENELTVESLLDLLQEVSSDEPNDETEVEDESIHSLINLLNNLKKED